MVGRRRGRLAGVLAGVILAAVVPCAAQAAPPLSSMAYGTLTNSRGYWAYPWSTGLRPSVVVPAIERSGAVFIRAGLESVPRPFAAQFYDRLHAEDPRVRLGVRLEIHPHSTVSGLLAEARALRHAPAGCVPAPSAHPCYFDWIFIDNAHALRSRRLQALIDGLAQTGVEGGGGWTRVMTNDTALTRHSQMARHEWVHSRSITLLGTRRWRHGGLRGVRRAIRHGRVLSPRDRSFIRAVRRRDPGSHVVLKFEVHTETDRLQSLSRHLQIRLIRELAHEQRSHHFHLLFPLFVSASYGHARPECRRACEIYNSLSGARFSHAARGQGTFRAQRRLLGG